MCMFLMTLLAAITLVYFLYEVIGGWAYRRPWVLLVAGLATAILGLLVKRTPMVLKAIPTLNWPSEDLELAMSAVDSIVTGLAGGLIAAAFMMKMQLGHAREVQDAKNALASANEAAAYADQADDDLKNEPATLPTAIFKRRYRATQRLKHRALHDKMEAEAQIRALRMPGLVE